MEQEDNISKYNLEFDNDVKELTRTIDMWLSRLSDHNEDDMRYHEELQLFKEQLLEYINRAQLDRTTMDPSIWLRNYSLLPYKESLNQKVKTLEKYQYNKNPIIRTATTATNFFMRNVVYVIIILLIIMLFLYFDPFNIVSFSHPDQTIKSEQYKP